MGAVYLVGGFSFGIFRSIFRRQPFVTVVSGFFLHWVAPNGSTGRAAKSNKTATY
jgi:hypothetical protein